MLEIDLIHNYWSTEQKFLPVLDLLISVDYSYWMCHRSDSLIIEINTAKNQLTWRITLSSIRLSYKKISFMKLMSASWNWYAPLYSLYKKKRKHYIIFNNLRTFEDDHFKLIGELDWHVPYQLDEFHIFSCTITTFSFVMQGYPWNQKSQKQYVMSITSTLKTTDSLCP